MMWRVLALFLTRGCADSSAAQRNRHANGYDGIVWGAQQAAIRPEYSLSRVLLRGTSERSFLNQQRWTHMPGYYAEKLSGARLRRCYEVASSRVRQYLEAEIHHTLERLRSTDTVLELGCGYGRIARRLAQAAHRVIGIDTAIESLDLARQLASPGGSCEFVQGNASALCFADFSFDAVLCLQNGICVFGVDHASLLREALRVTREGGIVLFSSYSDKFWPDRMAWFEAQAAEGLVGPIDRAASCDGVIVCQDGFRSGRMAPDDFRSLCQRIGVASHIDEVDASSVFCEITRSSGV